MKRLRFVAPIALLVLASACNGDDGNGNGDAGNGDTGDGGGSGLTEDQQAAADQLLTIGEEEGIAFDVGCVEEQAAQLSDEDAAAIVAAGPEGDVGLSADGVAITSGLYNCVDGEAMVDRFIDEMETAGVDIDEDCVRDALDGVNLADLFTGGEGGEQTESDPATAAAMLAMMECLGDLGDLGNLEDLGG